MEETELERKRRLRKKKRNRELKALRETPIGVPVEKIKKKDVSRIEYQLKVKRMHATISDIIRANLDSICDDQRRITWSQAIAETLMTLAVRGHLPSLIEVLNRTEGKVADKQEIDDKRKITLVFEPAVRSTGITVDATEVRELAEGNPVALLASTKLQEELDHSL